MSGSVLIGKKSCSSFFSPIFPFVLTDVFLFSDNITTELDRGDEVRHGTSPACLHVPCYSSVPQCCPTALPPGPRTSHVHTAPPSPRQRPRMATCVQLTKQASLDELRTTVQLAATSMESSIRNIELLGDKMAATTERLSDTVHDSCQALDLLTRAVDQLQSVLAGSQSQILVNQRDGTSQELPENQQELLSLTHQSRCSGRSKEAPARSQRTSCLSGSTGNANRKPNSS